MNSVLFSREVDDKPFKRSNWQKSHYLSVDDTNKKKIARNSVKRERTKIINFFMKKYEFYKVYKYIGENHLLYRLGALILSRYSLALIIISFVVSLYFQELPLFILIFGFLGLLLSVVIPSVRPISTYFFTLLTRYLGKEKPPSITHINASAPKMIVSILAGWLTLFPFSNELWEWNAQCKANPEWWWGFNITLVLLIIVIISGEIKALNPFQEANKSIWKLCRVFFTGFSFAIGVGILLFNLSCPYIFNNPEAFPISDHTFTHKNNIRAIVQHPNKINQFTRNLEEIKNMADLKDHAELNTVLGTELIDNNELKKDLLNLKTSESDSVYQVLHDNAIVKLKEYSIETEKGKHKLLREEAIKIAILEMSENTIPLIAFKKYGFLQIFIFPMMLIQTALIAFIIGFVIKFMVNAKVYKFTV